VREKSVGAEETFETDVTDPEVIRRELLRLSRRTSRALRSSGQSARTVVIKLRKADFATMTRSKTLPEPTNETQRIYATACALYAASGLSGQARLRLVGVRATGLVPAGAASTQLALGEQGASWRDAESALDRITGRFGPEAVRPASLVDRDRAVSRRPAGQLPVLPEWGK
jgi:DNA polymerase-4